MCGSAWALQSARMLYFSLRIWFETPLIFWRGLAPIDYRACKNMKKYILTLAVFMLPSLAHAQAAAGDPVAGKAKAVAICSGCHGIVGTKTAFPEVYHVPKIGGQNAAYIVAALKAYRAGERNNETMKSLASVLKESELADIAAYYAQK